MEAKDDGNEEEEEEGEGRGEPGQHGRQQHADVRQQAGRRQLLQRQVAEEVCSLGSLIRAHRESAPACATGSIEPTSAPTS